MEILQRFIVCYLGMGNGLSVLAEHISRIGAVDDVRSRDFSNSSLDGASFYIIEVTKLTPYSRTPQANAGASDE